MSRNHAKIGKGLSLSPVASRPSDPENGDIIYNSTTNAFEIYENGLWNLVGGLKSARYTLASSQTINDNSNTTVIWNTTRHSTFTTTLLNTSTGRITFSEGPGVYEVQVSIGIGSSTNIASGHRTATYIRVNGGTLRKIAGDTFEGSVFETKQWSGGDTVSVTSSSDYMDILAYLDFGTSSYNINTVDGGVTYINIKKIS